MRDDGSKVITHNNLSRAEESLETRLMIVHWLAMSSCLYFVGMHEACRYICMYVLCLL